MRTATERTSPESLPAMPTIRNMLTPTRACTAALPQKRKLSTCASWMALARGRSAVISAIQQAISLKSTYNIRVMNLSLARGVYESYTLDPLCQAVESAWQAGIVVVVAAGNMGEYNGSGTS